MIRLLYEINDMTCYARTVGAYAIEERLLGVYRDRYQTAANPDPAGTAHDCRR
jgi:hypothetical protein